MIQHIYKTLKAALGPIAPVSWYAEQYLQNGDQQLFETPAIFIEFSPVQTRTKPLLIQEATLEFTIHCVHESIGDDADDRMFDPVIHHLVDVDAIWCSIQGWSANIDQIPGYTGPPNTNKLINTIERTEIQFDHRASNLLTTIQRFRAQVFFYPAHEASRALAGPLTLTTNITY